MTNALHQSTIHGQYIADSVSLLEAIPRCADVLSHGRVIHIAAPDRKSKLDDEYMLVKETINSTTTARACVTNLHLPFGFRGQMLSGKDMETPFVETSTWLDLGGEINS